MFFFFFFFFLALEKKKKGTFTPHMFVASHDTDSEVASLSLGYTPCDPPPPPLLSMQVQPALIWGLGRWSYLKWSRASLSWLLTGRYRRGFYPLKACTRQEIPSRERKKMDFPVDLINSCCGGKWVLLCFLFVTFQFNNYTHSWHI